MLTYSTENSAFETQNIVEMTNYIYVSGTGNFDPDCPTTVDDFLKSRVRGDHLCRGQYVFNTIGDVAITKSFECEETIFRNTGEVVIEGTGDKTIELVGAFYFAYNTRVKIGKNVDATKAAFIALCSKFDYETNTFPVSVTLGGFIRSAIFHGDTVIPYHTFGEMDADILYPDAIKFPASNHGPSYFCTKRNSGAVKFASLVDMSNVIISGGSTIIAPKVKRIHDEQHFGASFKDIIFASLETIPERITFQNSGSVELKNLTEIPDGVVFANGSRLLVPNVERVGKDVTIGCNGWVSLEKCKPFEHDVKISKAIIGGDVFPARGMNLSSAFTGRSKINGEEADFIVDGGFVAKITHSRKQDDVTIHLCREWFTPTMTMYIAEQIIGGEQIRAHGYTIARAISDLVFKIERVAPVDEIIQTIKQTGEVTSWQFRILTGACEMGLREGMKRLGLDPMAKTLPLDVVLETADTEYGIMFKKHFS